MSRRIPAFLALWLCLMAIISSSAQAPRTIRGAYDYDKARQVVSNINRLRQGKGISPLKMDAALTEAAMLRAAELAFRTEVEQLDKYSDNYEKRPNGEKNLNLINEQRHTPLLKVDFTYLHLSHKPYTNIGDVVKSLKKRSETSTLHSVGCGAFLSPQGFYYWVLYLMPDNGTDGDIPGGQWFTEVGIGTSPGEKTSTLSRIKSDTDLTPKGFEMSGLFHYSEAITVVEITNKERAAKGLKPCILDSTLMELAMLRAAEMKAINKMTHTRPNGESGPSIILSVKKGYTYAGENIAHGQSSAQEIMTAWMNSPGHRGNILTESYTHMGAGMCDGYWVQLFAKNDKRLPVMSKSSAHTDEVTVWITTVVDGEESKVLKRKRIR